MRRICPFWRYHEQLRRRFKIGFTAMSEEEAIDFSSMRVVELRSFLDSKGLPKIGNKQTLLDRATSYWSHFTRMKSDSNNTEIKEEKTCEAPYKNVPETISDERKHVTKTSEEGAADFDLEQKDGNAAETVSDIPIKQEEQESRRCEVTEVHMETSETPVVEENNTFRGQKRHHSFSPFPRKKMRKGPVLPKNPLQILNERYPGLKYEVLEQSGPPNQPVFVVGVEVNGVLYTGSGSSKRAAKHAAASKALQQLVPMYPPPLPQSLPMSLDFTSDSPVWEAGSLFIDHQAPESQLMDFSSTTSPFFIETTSLEKTQAKILSKSPEDKHPVMLLNSLLPGLAYELCEEQTGKLFSMRTVINEVEYRAEGRNKKLAKFAVAVKALKDQFGIVTRQLPDQLPVVGLDNDDNGAMDIVDAGTLPDLVCDLVKAKFSSLTDNLKSPHAKKKVLAGIVLTRSNGPDVESGEVICIATGTKCINGGYMSDTGTALNDCHAEVICRRGLRRYLYQMLLQYADNKENSIFEACEKGETSHSGGYRLKPDVYFNLYINTSPCGDSRIFSPHETNNHTDDHPNRKARGQLRTKIEAGEGTIPVQPDSLASDGVQPWDAVISGERLLTMSCSDKLARWNLIGIQGSLLSLYIEPVYLSSIILGSLYHSTHFARGMYNRVKEAIDAFSDSQNEKNDMKEMCEQIIKEPFKLHHPILASVTTPESRNAVKAPSFCFHWTSGDDEPHIINTITGKGEADKTSNLCKLDMFRLFQQLASSPDLLPKVNLTDSTIPMAYGDIKKQAVMYQELKANLTTGFKAAGLGTWVKKPAEVDSFYLPESNPNNSD